MKMTVSGNRIILEINKESDKSGTFLPISAVNPDNESE